jgi:hypothetical protein
MNSASSSTPPTNLRLPPEESPANRRIRFRARVEENRRRAMAHVRVFAYTVGRCSESPVA